VTGTAREEGLGGAAIDERVAAHCLAEFRRRHPALGGGAGGDARARRRLLVACEGAKRALSDGLRAAVEVESAPDAQLPGGFCRGRFDTSPAL
jgi:molecular chaperone DnaK (HSP70)